LTLAARCWLASATVSPMTSWFWTFRLARARSSTRGLVSVPWLSTGSWVCPLFEPFLAWLLAQDLSDLDALPDFAELPDAPGAMFGYRRAGWQGDGADLEDWY
jgi:hypothetical protein